MFSLRSAAARPQSKAVRLVASALAAAGIMAGALLSPAQADATMMPYPVQNDPFSQFSAGKGGEVHNRVGGNLHSSPVAPAAANEAAARGKALIGPGTPVTFDGKFICTITAAGFDAQGNKIAVSAGHCGDIGSVIRSMDAHNVGTVGKVVKVNRKLDYSVIMLDNKAEVTRNYGPARATSQGGRLPNSGETACKLGIATGWSCGPTWVTDRGASWTQICAAQGDSGGPVFMGGRLVGSIKGANFPPACLTPLQGPLFAPTVIGSWQETLNAMNAAGGAGAGFRLP